MLIQEMAIEQAKSFVAECQQSGITLEKAILFGSAARNQLTNEVNIRYPFIEVHHFNSYYFRAGDPFVQEITETGIALI